MKRRSVSFAFALPAFLIYTILFMIPLVMAIGLSFTKWDGLGDIAFIGLRNFSRIFRDARLGNAVENTLLITVVQVTMLNGIGLFFAIVLNKTTLRSKIFRTAYFIPVVMSSVAVSFIWKSILSYNGVYNSIMTLIGHSEWMVNSMSNRASALTSICIVDLWKNFGYYMMLYIAGLQTVPEELYDACVVDGGNAWDKFKHVTLPCILPSATVSVIMSMINGLRTYDTVKIMTDGGPGFDTETVVYNIMAQGFSGSRMGYACAIAVMLFMVIAAVSVWVINRSNQLEAK